MARFLNLFPKIPYDINRNKYAYSDYELVTNLTFRFGIIKNVLSSISSYFLYTITDADTPEILSEKIYGDPESYWIILYANDMYDPQYDWPMNYDVFNKYITKKYGSLSSAKTTIHHYEKVVSRTESFSGLTTETRFRIDYQPQTNTVLQLNSVMGNFTVGNTIFVSLDTTLANALITGTVSDWSNATNEITLSNLVVPGNTQILYQILQEANSSVTGNVISYVVPSVPYDTYLSLPATQSVEKINLNGRTTTEIISRDAISCYDYEEQLNEKRRIVKIIKPEYYTQIMNEFNTLTGDLINPYYKKFTVTG